MHAIVLLFLSLYQSLNHETHNYVAVQLLDPSQQLALKNYTLVERIGNLEDYYLYSIPKHSSNLYSRSLITNHLNVKWHEEQIPQQRLFRRTATHKMAYLRQKLNILDPGFDYQWHLVNNKDIGSDLNVTGVWEEGITGKGIIISFIDDGLEYEHPDLKDNFWLEGSYDYNDHQKLPTPKNWDDKHGTRCAGEVAAVKNSACGVGIAYDAKVAGIRILSGALTNADEAAAINYGFDKTHIYSCSWGPKDDGKTMDAAPHIVKVAVKNGVVNGRGGLGSIFVFAAGNGGSSGDNWYKSKLTISAIMTDTLTVYILSLSPQWILREAIRTTPKNVLQT